MFIPKYSKHAKKKSINDYDKQIKFRVSVLSNDIDIPNTYLI